MNILAAIKREEKRLEKQMSKLQHQLNGIRSAAKALGHSAAVEVKGAKKRVLSAAGRAAISKAAKKRWANVKKQANKALS
jgi:t-SNARE complex subunit (syntaxin)